MISTINKQIKRDTKQHATDYTTGARPGALKGRGWGTYQGTVGVILIISSAVDLRGFGE